MLSPPAIRSLVSSVLDRCDALSRLSEDPDRLTRTFLSPPMRDVHRKVTEWMTEAGMSVRIDAIGNIIGRREGAAPGAPALLIGSHLDTVPDAGKFDGILGVMLGIAAAQAATDLENPPGFPIEVVGFSDEEGIRFGSPFLASKAFIGKSGPEISLLRDRNGLSVAQAIAAFGLNPAPVAFERAKYLGYVEAHIEQGPVLESAAQPLGVVSVITGQSRRRVHFAGRAAHAGTTPMGARNDALAAAAQWVGQVESLAKGEAGAVATVGQISVTPGASNVIPGEATLSVDVRHPNDEIRLGLLGRILAAGGAIGDARGVTFEVRDGVDQPSVGMSPGLSAVLKNAVDPGAMTLPSGAGHDAAILAQVMPACMLFIRSPAGVSHHPDERVYAADVERALRALVRFIETLHPGDIT